MIHTNLIFWYFYLFGFWGSTLRVKIWLKSCHKSLLSPIESHISKVTSLWVTWFRSFHHSFLAVHGFHQLISCLVWFLFSIIITHHSTKLRMNEWVVRTNFENFQILGKWIKLQNNNDTLKNETHTTKLFLSSQKEVMKPNGYLRQ